ncbi:MAG: ATP-binding protein [Deltaproteobacteria bacterium]|nr:ATP-binding protein [Myxococcales bacterium]MDP3220005.1 ATP-binding protein [Deltaproteobacteria bacterium]
MRSAEPGARRVLVLAPIGRDASLMLKVLAHDGLSAEACGDVVCLCREIDRGAGAVVLTEEALTPDGVHSLVESLGRQPAWSDLPLVVCTWAGAVSHASAGRLRAVVSRGNVTLVERPTSARTFVSAMRAALNARERQYELRDVMEERERLLRDAEEASRLKDEFLATVSHELRTPLTAMLGWSQMLRSGGLSEAKRRMALETIERNARAQAQLVDDLLDVSRIVSGQLRMEMAAVEPAQFVEQAAESVRVAADAKGVALELAIDPDAGPVLGDTARLQQVAWNLLVNAVKFTPRGGRVGVTGRRVGGHVELAFSDTGSGVSQEFLPHLFERFRQADGSSTRAQGGLGLGLSIVKHLVELHGGTIAAESDGEGRGARFIVRLPALPGVTALASEGASNRPGLAFDCPPELSGLRVLVVEDEPDTRSLLVMVLELCEVSVSSAATVAEARELIALDPPEVLISDIGMPGGDGYALIRGVRALPADRGGRVPALALTAYARAEDRARALRAGFDEHLPKPVEPSALVRVLARLARPELAATAPAR